MSADLSYLPEIEGHPPRDECPNQVYRRVPGGHTGIPTEWGVIGLTEDEYLHVVQRRQEAYDRAAAGPDHREPGMVHRAQNDALRELGIVPEDADPPSLETWSPPPQARGQ